MANVVGGAEPAPGSVAATARSDGPQNPVGVLMERAEASFRWGAVLGILLPAKVLAALPVVVLAAVLTVAQILVAWYGFWAALCVGRYPENARRLSVDVLRLQAQLAAWIYSYTDGYPPLGLGVATRGVAVEALDRGDPPVRVALWPFPGGIGPGTGVNRWWAVLGVLLPLRVLAAIPHVIIVVALSVAALVLGWISFWIILFVGRYPRGLWRFNSGVLRWGLRLWGFTVGLTDRYPPFSLA